jgi:hypothetical protein
VTSSASGVVRSAVTGLGQDEPRLAALYPEAVGELGRVPGAPVWRGRIDLGVQGLQFVRVRGGPSPVKQLERHFGLRHDHLHTWSAVQSSRRPAASRACAAQADYWLATGYFTAAACILRGRERGPG